MASGLTAQLRVSTEEELQAKLAEAIHQGIRDYFYANPPTGTRIEQLAAVGTARPVLATRSGAGE